MTYDAEKGKWRSALETPAVRAGMIMLGVFGTGFILRLVSSADDTPAGIIYFYGLGSLLALASVAVGLRRHWKRGAAEENSGSTPPTDRRAPAAGEGS